MNCKKLYPAMVSNFFTRLFHAAARKPRDQALGSGIREHAVAISRPIKYKSCPSIFGLTT
jgi:hypothetical protein